MFMKVQVSSIWKEKKLSYEGQQDSNPTTQVNPVYQPNH